MILHLFFLKLTSIKTTLRSPVYREKLCSLFGALKILLFNPFNAIAESKVTIIKRFTSVMVT